MEVKDKLDFLSRANRFKVEKKKDNYTKQETYEITFNDSTELAAKIEGDEITYHVTGVYDSGCDWAEIDIESLQELKNFCEFLTK